MKLLLVGNGSFYLSEDFFFVNKHTAKFANEIASIHDVSFLQFKEHADIKEGVQDTPLCEDIRKIGVDYSPKASVFRKVLSYINLFFLSLNEVYKADAIYIFYPGHSPKIVATICAILNKKFGLYIRGEGSLNSHIEKFILKKSKFCLCVSQNFADEVSDYCVDVDVIRPMIDFKEADIRHRNFDKKEVNRLLFVGRVSNWKGIPELVEAFKNLKAKYEGMLELHIVGAGELTEKLSEEFRMDNSVFLHGVISSKEELQRIYDNSDFFVLPSYKEGFPRVIYEAMISGLPIITTNVGGISTLLDNEESCLYIDVGSVSDIEKSVIRLMNSLELQKRISENATQKISSVFDRKTHLDLLLSRID